jgi:NTP pyrophosphatase (non-canonical NTP hydrolase)
MKEISITECQKLVDQWINEYGVRYFDELTNLGILMEEVGEVARLMVRIYGEQSFKNKEQEKDLAEELGDVFFVLLCIANQCHIDLTTAFQNGMIKRTQRDKTRHRENDKLTPRSQS